MNKRGLSRMLSVLLLVVMVVSMLPVSAYAEGTTATLVTDISSLSVGDKVVVVAKDATGKIVKTLTADDYTVKYEYVNANNKNGATNAIIHS